MATTPGYSTLVDDGQFLGSPKQPMRSSPGAGSGGGDTETEGNEDNMVRGVTVIKSETNRNDIAIIGEQQQYDATMAAVDNLLAFASVGDTVMPLHANPEPTHEGRTPPHPVIKSVQTSPSSRPSNFTGEGQQTLSVDGVTALNIPPLRSDSMEGLPQSRREKGPGWNLIHDLIPEDWTPLRIKRESDDDAVESTVERSRRWARNVAILLAVLLVLAGLFFAAKEYMGPLLEWVQKENPVVGGIAYFLIVVLTCFPGMMGYVIVNVGAGYIYGCWYGLFFMAPASLLGCLVAFLMLKKMCLSCTRYSKRKYKNYKQLVKLLEGEQGLKYICMIRCCPLPVGIENSLLAMSDVSTGRFILGTLIGMLPNTLLYSYLGSELQSLDGVTEGKSPVGVIVAEVILIIAITTYIGYRVNSALKKSQEELPYSPTGSAPPPKGDELTPLLGAVRATALRTDGGGGTAAAAGEKAPGERSEPGRSVSLYQSAAW